jgi:hypothetical protein
MCARIRPDRLITTTACRETCVPAGVSSTTASASLFPPGLGSADSWTGIADGQPSAALSVAAVTRVRFGCPGTRSSTARSGAVGPLKHWNADDAADALSGTDTMAAAEPGSPTAAVTVPSMRPFPSGARTRSATQDWLEGLTRLHVIATTYLLPSANDASAQP